MSTVMTAHSSAQRWRGRFWRLVLLIGIAFSLNAAMTAAADADASAGVATVVDPQTGNPLGSGGSATKFALQLPPGARCPGDTQHADYLLYSYVIPASMSPASLTYVDGTPATGVTLVDSDGDPWVQKATGVGSGSVEVGSIFDWSTYDHASNSLDPGQIYNVGISCSPGAPGTALPVQAGAAGTQPRFKTVTYWNAKFHFLTSRTDPGGFTWVVVSSPAASTSSSSTGLYIAIGLLAVIAALAAAVAVRFWRRRPVQPADA
jgi:hypothetical protein